MQALNQHLQGQLHKEDVLHDFVKAQFELLSNDSTLPARNDPELTAAAKAAAERLKELRDEAAPTTTLGKLCRGYLQRSRPGHARDELDPQFVQFAVGVHNTCASAYAAFRAEVPGLPSESTLLRHRDKYINSIVSNLDRLVAQAKALGLGTSVRGAILFDDMNLQPGTSEMSASAVLTVLLLYLNL